MILLRETKLKKMKILTNAPHENNGGHTLVLFGKPWIKFQPSSGHLVYVDCYIVKATKLEKFGYCFENTDELNLSQSSLKKMQAYAKKLAESHIKKKGWSLKKKHTGYTQNPKRSGFYFFVKT